MVVLLCANYRQLDFPTSNVASERAEKKARIECLWQELFSDPSQWCDYRLTKKSPRHPDFKHKRTLEALWIDNWSNPPWVKEKLATMKFFDPILPSSISISRIPASLGNYDKIQKLTREGRLKEALQLLKFIAQQTSEAPPPRAFACLLRGCTRRKALTEGREVHAFIVKTKCDTNIFLSNLLIGMYSACGSVTEAVEVFTAISERNVFSWTAMISAYAKNRLYKETVALFQKMHQAGIEPSKIVQTTLVDVYSKCGCIKDARELFDHMKERDVISWNAMIAGYAQKGLGKEALHLYEQMKQESMEPDNTTVVLLLKACASISALQQGKQLHSLILQKNLESETKVQTALLDMYAKCGCLEDARELFDNMTRRDVIAWTSMISGYAQKGLGKESLDLYEQMKYEGMEPDNFTLVLLLKACASISALQQGKELHSLILEKGLESEVIVQTTLVDMYSKCGCLKDARELFDNMTERNVISWTAMIAGYAQEGLGKEVLELFKRMKDEGLQANDITYISVLAACSHSGLVDEGCQVFESMSKDDGVTPNLEHYGCMVDLLGRAGCLSDAEALILKMPIEPGEAIWMSLLDAARKYANVEIGRRAFHRIMELQPENAAPYLLLIDIYSAAGRMDEK